jgi:hypothetical protein
MTITSHKTTVRHSCHHIRSRLNAISSSLLTSHPNVKFKLDLLLAATTSAPYSSTTTSDDHKTASDSKDTKTGDKGVGGDGKEKPSVPKPLSIATNEDIKGMKRLTDCWMS